MLGTGIGKGLGLLFARAYDPELCPAGLDIENADLDKMEEEIELFSVNLKKKYKEYLPKKDLDFEE